MIRVLFLLSEWGWIVEYWEFGVAILLLTAYVIFLYHC